VQQLGAPGFYHIVARYGYAQRIQQGPEFVKVANSAHIPHFTIGTSDGRQCCRVQQRPRLKTLCGVESFMQSSHYDYVM
jgi:hypothetical protein